MLQGHRGRYQPLSRFKYSVSRVNTMAHQKVMEAVMKQYAMLPVRFGTVGEGLA